MASRIHNLSAYMYQRIKFLLVACFLFSAAIGYSQAGCVATTLNGSIINLPCGVNCAPLTFKVPNLKSTADYVVNTIPYNPLEYITATGTEQTSLYADDEYSSVIDLPFSFCFYGEVYNQVVVGSNGLVTFDVSNANCDNGYLTNNPIPYSGGTQCNASSMYYPKASIMGAYSDLDPRASASPADRKIQWRVEGDAPCRKFVVSFYHLGVFGANACAVTMPTTFQIVMYESTGLIDVFFEQKNCNSSSSAGKAILGVQNLDRTKAVAASGKNATVWSERNSGYRFTPSGADSRFVKSELYSFSGTLLFTTTPADTTTTTPGLLDVTFPSICPPNPSTQYIVKTYYASCSDPTQQLTSTDTIRVNKNGLNASASSTPSSCSPSGTIFVTLLSSGTAPYSYQLNSGTPQTSNFFTSVPAGLHTITITDATGCTTTTTVTVGSSATVNATATAIAALCNGSNTGSITAAGAGGSPPYQYNINGGAYQSSGTFNGLAAATYTVTVKDGGGCISNPITVTVGQPTAVVINATGQAAKCNGAADGVITISGSGGTSPYQYSIDGTAYGASGTFNVGAGSYTAYIKDANGCIKQQPVVITEPAALISSASTTNASCNGGADGTITVTAGGGTAPYQYSIAGSAFGASNVFNVAPGTHTITIKDANGCTRPQSATVGLTNDLTFTPLANDTLCEGTSMVLQPVSNATSYTWSGTALSLNNPAGSSVTVNPATATQYTVVGNFGRCTYNDTVDIFVYTAPVPDAGEGGEICYGQDFQLSAAPGMVRYEWSPARYLSGNTTSFDPDVIRPDSTITYNLNVVDVNGCRSLASDAVTVEVTPPIIVITNPTDTIVYIGDVIQVTASSAGTDYLWSPSYGLSDPTSKSPTITVDRDITYTIEATTAAGCQGDTTITIRAFKGPEIYVPTGFTPNKDGHNDLLRPFPVGIKTLNYFRVFNRWGNMVYSWAGIDRGPVVFNLFSSNIGWDGTHQGKPLTSGTFVWVAEGVTKEGKTIQRKGTTTLIR